MNHLVVGPSCAKFGTSMPQFLNINVLYNFLNIDEFLYPKSFFVIAEMQNVTQEPEETFSFFEREYKQDALTHVDVSFAHI